jgi:GT2 family glycosyltransferase
MNEANQAYFLSIIIVNYNASELILQCLQSINRHINLFLEFIVVDNSVNSKGRIAVLKSYPEVQWIDMGYNAGFARANNRGMKAAKGDIFLLLNPDTIAIDDSITRCYNYLKQSPYSAAGVQILNEKREPQISGNYFVRGGLNHILPIPYWGNFIRWLGYKVKAQVPNVQMARDIEEVDWISGAFLMVKREAVETAGFMDEDFFLYGEEVEWCSRLKKAGPLCIYGNLRIIHLEGATINKSQNLDEKGYYNVYDRKGLQLMVSNHVRVRKQYGSGWFLILLLNYTWGVLFFFIIGTLDHIAQGKNPSAQWKKLIAFTRNLFHLWKLSPTIIRNKPHFYKML